MVSMHELNLSKEFADFNKNMEARHQQSIKNHQKTYQGFVGSAVIATIATMGIIASGPTTVPILGTALAIGHGSFIGAGITKLSEAFKNKKFNDNYYSSSHFLKSLNKFRKSFGKKEYEKFVNETVENDPLLAKTLSVHKDFNKLREKAILRARLEDADNRLSQSNVSRKNKNSRSI